MTYQAVKTAADAAGLIVMGALHPARCEAKDLTNGTLILLGAGPGFWPVFNQAPEAADRLPDPIDRWSTRVIRAMAAHFQATAHYPFGGPPFKPFIDWALKSKRAFLSPVGMMVHDQVGLMISYRGALHFPQEFPVPTPDNHAPCETCVDRPCASACPVSALSVDSPYDLNVCHAHLDTNAGQPCMTLGCAARRACPISVGAERDVAQSSLHMKAFHPQ